MLYLKSMVVKHLIKVNLIDLKNEIRAIEAQSLSYTEESQNDLINLKWIFILLFVFLTIEWFLRKRILLFN